MSGLNSALIWLPTSSISADRSSLPASSRDTVLTVSSSAARCCASAKSRAFSIATAAASDRPTRNSSSLVWNGLPAGAPHRHRALHRLAGAQRRHHQPLVAGLLGAGDLDRARVVVRVVDELGAAARDDAADDADTRARSRCPSPVRPRRPPRRWHGRTAPRRPCRPPAGRSRCDSAPRSSFA